MSSRKPATELPRAQGQAGKARGRAPFLFLAPAIIVVFAVLIFPIIFSLFVSTYNWPLSQGAGVRRFVGLGNYAALTQDPEFWNSLKLQLGFIFIAIPIELLFGFAAALLLNREFFGARVVRSLLLLPVFFLPILSGMTWRFMLQPRYGPLNALLLKLGAHEITWLGNPATAYAAIIVQDIWRMWPFMFMLLYAALTAIPQELMEAAEIDGAGFWLKLRSLTIPLLTPTILTAVLLRIIDALRVFSEVYVMTEGGPGSATMLFSLYTQRQAFGYQKVGMASAMAIFLLVISIVFALTLVRKNMSLDVLEEKAGA
ncbi:MAG: carbohydrate ABC transporter permease [Rectinema subterraneum]|uniref:carbohydrate ABC transporter permease n=1 Tax=Rectinema subterraneum TaxID=2653714 RepID=UPI003C797BFC